MIRPNEKPMGTAAASIRSLKVPVVTPKLKSRMLMPRVERRTKGEL